MTPSGQTAPAARRPIWAGPLLAGLCFGLVYGVSQRLLAINVGELIRLGQSFDVKVFPGTSLDSLRLRYGVAEGEPRSNPDPSNPDRAEGWRQSNEPSASAPTEPPAEQQAAPEAARESSDGATQSDAPPAADAGLTSPPPLPTPAPARP